MSLLSFDSAVPLGAEVAGGTHTNNMQSSATCTWLDGALRAERTTLARLIEQSHDLLLADYVAWESGRGANRKQVPASRSGHPAVKSKASITSIASEVWASQEQAQKADNEQGNRALNTICDADVLTSEVWGQKSKREQKSRVARQSEDGPRSWGTKDFEAPSRSSSVGVLLPAVIHHSDRVARVNEDGPHSWGTKDFEAPTRSISSSVGLASTSSLESSPSLVSTVILHGSEHSDSESLDSAKIAHLQSRHSIFVGRVSARASLKRGWTTRVAHSPSFEVAFGVLILINALVMALECQYDGFSLGYDLQFPKYLHRSEETWPGMKPVFIASDTFFGLVFTLEIVLKLAGLRQDFVRDVWNIFDLLIVLGWILDTLTRNVVSIPVDFLFLRITRLARLLRLLRLMKTLYRMDSLYLMIATLESSVLLLFWSTCLLLLALVLMGFLVNQIVVSYYLKDETADIQSRLKLFEYFGSFSRCMLTMFELTLGNYAPVARVLHENSSEWFMLFTLFHKLTLGFAALSVINGIFLSETLKAASLDDNVLVLQKEMARKMFVKKMQSFVRMADASGDGLIDIKEFRAILSNDKVKTWLAAQGLDTSGNSDVLFMMLDADKSGEITMQEIVEGVAKLQGNARSFDIAKLSCSYDQLLAKVGGLEEGLRSLVEGVRGRSISKGSQICRLAVPLFGSP